MTEIDNSGLYEQIVRGVPLPLDQVYATGVAVASEVIGALNNPRFDVLTMTGDDFDYCTKTRGIKCGQLSVRAASGKPTRYQVIDRTTSPASTIGFAKTPSEKVSPDDADRMKRVVDIFGALLDEVGVDTVRFSQHFREAHKALLVSPKKVQ